MSSGGVCSPAMDGLGGPAALERSKRARDGGTDPSPQIEGDGADEAPGTPKAKRARRKLSCLSCQKLKCRCEYDAAAHACVRCRNLRISCSLSDAEPQGLAPRRLGKEPAIVEERLKQHDQALSALQADVRHLLNKLGQPDSTAQPAPAVSLATVTCHEAEELSAPADISVPCAPSVIVRDLSLRLAGGFRRTLQNVGPNLIELGLLDLSTAETLYRAAVQYPTLRGHSLDPQHEKTLCDSPFLHATCCLLGIYLGNPELKGTALHREIYEHVRIALGQVLMASPLPLDEIDAVILLNTYPPIPVKMGTEYIDSWLLSGSCAQQAMLSISFARIVKNIKAVASTASDHRALRLWGRICLQHLQWGATTGRPPTIPSQYLDQCNLLLSVYDATIQDEMLVAEILLYRVLHNLLADHPKKSPTDRPRGHDDGELQSWKNKWSHLFGLPRSVEFKMAYCTVCLIRAIQSTEDDEHRMKTAYNSAMDAAASASHENSMSATAGQHAREPKNQGHTPQPIARGGLPGPVDADAQKASTVRLSQEHVLMLSMQMLGTLLEMARPDQLQITDYVFMCAAYAALIVGHRGHLVQERNPMGLLMAVHNLPCTGPVLSVAANLAMTTLRAALAQPPHAAPQRRAPGSVETAASDQMPGTTVAAEHGRGQDLSTSLENMPLPHHYALSEPPTTLSSMPAIPQIDGLGLPDDDDVFPTLEGFFRGGFLDLIG